jgi:hypothetical protein
VEFRSVVPGSRFDGSKIEWVGPPIKRLALPARRWLMVALGLPALAFGVAFALGAATKTRGPAPTRASTSLDTSATGASVLPVAPLQSPPSLKVKPKPGIATPPPRATSVSSAPAAPVVVAAPRQASQPNASSVLTTPSSGYGSPPASNPVSTAGGDSSSSTPSRGAGGSGASGGGGSTVASRPVAPQPSPPTATAPAPQPKAPPPSSGTGTVSGGG